jgi:hypothetical protein
LSRGGDKIRRMSEHRLSKAMDIWRRWDRRSNDLASPSATRLADKHLNELAEFCAPEISQVLKASGDGIVAERNVIRRVALGGVRRAAETLRDGHGRDLLEHVNVCVEEVLWEIIAERKAKLERHTPEALLKFLLLLPRDIAASQLALLGPEKSLDLLELKEVRVANMLPALLIAPLLVALPLWPL